MFTGLKYMLWMGGIQDFYAVGLGAGFGLVLPGLIGFRRVVAGFCPVRFWRVSF
jgi:hypothetical protein